MAFNAEGCPLFQKGWLGVVHSVPSAMSFVQPSVAFRFVFCDQGGRAGLAPSTSLDGTCWTTAVRYWPSSAPDAPHIGIWGFKPPLLFFFVSSSSGSDRDSDGDSDSHSSSE